MGHHHHILHDFLLVLAEELQPQEEEHPEVSVDVGIFAFHQFDVVVGQFEWRPLETHISWTARNHEAEIDVDKVAIRVDQNIVVMSIFDLEQVLHQGVPSQALDEVGGRLFPVFPINLLVDLPQRFFLRLLFQITHCLCAINELY